MSHIVIQFYWWSIILLVRKLIQFNWTQFIPLFQESVPRTQFDCFYFTPNIWVFCELSRHLWILNTGKLDQNPRDLRFIRTRNNATDRPRRAFYECSAPPVILLFRSASTGLQCKYHQSTGYHTKSLEAPPRFVGHWSCCLRRLSCCRSSVSSEGSLYLATQSGLLAGWLSLSSRVTDAAAAGEYSLHTKQAVDAVAI